MTILTLKESSNGTKSVMFPRISVVLADFLLRYNSYFILLFILAEEQRISAKKLSRYLPWRKIFNRINQHYIIVPIGE